MSTDDGLVEVYLTEDYYLGVLLSDKPSDVTVRVPVDQAQRWSQAFDRYETAQHEMDQMYQSALSALREQAVTEPAQEESRCYVTPSGISVHRKPGCRCGERLFPW